MFPTGFKLRLLRLIIAIMEYFILGFLQPFRCIFKAEISIQGQTSWPERENPERVFNLDYELLTELREAFLKAWIALLFGAE